MTEPARRKVGGSAPGERRGNAGKGRVKGTPNKTTKAAKEGLELAFEGLGGVEALTTWAKENQTEFYKLWAKLLPVQVKADVDNTHTGTIAFTWLPPE